MKDGSLLCHCEAYWILSSGLAPVMNCLSARMKNDLPSGISRAPAPIHIIAIHEQVFVEQPNRFEGFAADKGETSDYYIHGQCPVMREVKHVFAGKEP